ncbi:DUF3404 domain-containing protein [Vibrio lentus]|nr:DUF3404 domain-containing protein [Vibrio lentus]
MDHQKNISTLGSSLRVIVSANAFADSLPERIDHFTKLFDHQTAIESYDIRLLQADFHYPTPPYCAVLNAATNSRVPIKRAFNAFTSYLRHVAGKLPLSPLITEPEAVSAQCVKAPSFLTVGLVVWAYPT